MFLKVQFVFGIFMIISCTASIAGVLLIFPDFPPHFQTLWNFNYVFGSYISDSKHACIHRIFIMLLRKILHNGIFLIEVYEHFIVWSVFASFDTLLSMTCWFVTATLGKMEFLLTNRNCNIPHLCFLYRQLIIHVKMIERVFGPIIFTQELVNLAINVFTLYCMVTFGTKGLIFSFVFTFTGIGITARMFLLYMPMSNVYFESISFRKLTENIQNSNHLSVIGNKTGPSSSSQNDGCYCRKKRKKNALVLAELRTLRSMHFRLCGVHRITPSSISDYMLALFSNYYTVRNI